MFYNGAYVLLNLLLNMKTYKLLTHGFSATVNTDEQSIHSIIELLENLGKVIEVYEISDKDVSLIKHVKIKY